MEVVVIIKCFYHFLSEALQLCHFCCHNNSVCIHIIFFPKKKGRDKKMMVQFCKKKKRESNNKHSNGCSHFIYLTGKAEAC